VFYPAIKHPPFLSEKRRSTLQHIAAETVFSHPQIAFIQATYLN
jgi:hypothetical protein